MAKNKYQKMHEKYISKMDSLRNQKEMKDVVDSIKAGRTHVLRMRRYESSSFDVSWIKKIEDVIFDLGNIVQNPKKVTKSDTSIVPVELARKIGAESVQHLASHTNYVKEVDENGNVIPSKILNLGSDDDYCTYENKFVATLIRRLVLFVEKRYDYVSHVQSINNTEMMTIKNKCNIDGMDVEVETKIRVTQPASADQEQYRECINRILEIRKYLSYYYNSDFMKKLKNERDVHNPILQTNIIRKNPEYNHCYRLFKFLESYSSLGVSHKVNETYSNFEEGDFEKVNSTILANFLALNVTDLDPSPVKKKEIKFAPKVLTSIDDEEFVYRNRLFKGPIEFVRIDPEYQKYINKKFALPQYMKNAERIYNEDEIILNKKADEDLKQVRELIKRKKDELAKWKAHVADTLDKMQREKEEAKRKEELKKLREKESRIEAARKELINAAKENMKQKEQEKAAKDEKKLNK